MNGCTDPNTPSRVFLPGASNAPHDSQASRLLRFPRLPTASARVRARLGVSRLSPALASEVRAAVARHEARAKRDEQAWGDPLQIAASNRFARLEAVVSAAVRPHVRECYRQAQSSWAGGETTIDVYVSRATKADGYTERAWSSNGKWSGNNVILSVNVQPCWRKEIEAKGLAVLDGLLTTHALPIFSEGGYEVYRASWVRQGRGYDLMRCSGEIAYHRPTDTAFHGNPGKSLAGLRRKIKSQAIPTEEQAAKRAEQAQAREARRAAQIDALASRFASGEMGELAEVEVTLADSRRAGNCVTGSENFRDRVFPDRESVTIGEIAEALAEDGASQSLTRSVAAACLVAARRAKRMVPA